MAPVLAFDRSARYGAAIVCMLAGAYLGVAADFSAIARAEAYAGTIRSDAPLVGVVQFLLVLGAMNAAVVLLPTSPWRRLGAVTVVSVVLLLWATFGMQHAAGRLGAADGVWRFLLDQGLIVLVASVGGWVIARGRHPATWVVVVVAAAPAVVSPILADDEFPSGAVTLIVQGTVLVAGLGAVWLAAALDRRLASPRSGHGGGAPGR